MNKNVLLVTVAATALIAGASLASAQTMEAPKAEDAKKPEETKKAPDSKPQTSGQAPKAEDAKKPEDAKKAEDAKKPEDTKQQGQAGQAGGGAQADQHRAADTDPSDGDASGRCPARLQRQLLALGGHRGAADREIRSAPAAGRGDLSRMARLPFLHRWRPDRHRGAGQSADRRGDPSAGGIASPMCGGRLQSRPPPFGVGLSPTAMSATQSPIAC